MLQPCLPISCKYHKIQERAETARKEGTTICIASEGSLVAKSLQMLCSAMNDHSSSRADSSLLCLLNLQSLKENGVSFRNFLQFSPGYTYLWMYEPCCRGSDSAMFCYPFATDQYSSQRLVERHSAVYSNS